MNKNIKCLALLLIFSILQACIANSSSMEQAVKLISNDQVNGTDLQQAIPQITQIEKSTSKEEKIVVQKPTPKIITLFDIFETQQNTTLPYIGRQLQDLAFSPEGILYVVTSNGFIFQIDLENNHTQAITKDNKPLIDFATAITIDNNKNIFLSNTKCLYKISYAGAVKNSQCSSIDFPFYNLSDIAVDKNGNVFVSETSNNSIYKLTPSGEISLFVGNIIEPNTAFTGVAGASDSLGING